MTTVKAGPQFRVAAGRIGIVEVCPWEGAPFGHYKIVLQPRGIDDAVTVQMTRGLTAAERALLVQKLRLVLDTFWRSMFDAVDVTKLEAEAHNGSGPFVPKEEG